jgi:hypothetical protein
MASPASECSSSEPFLPVPPRQNGSQRSEDEMENLEQFLDVGTTILGQALDLLNNSLISDEQLTVRSQYMPGSTIGAVSAPPPRLSAPGQC